MDTNYSHQFPLLDSCDIFYGIELSSSMDTDAYMSQGLMDTSGKPMPHHQHHHHHQQQQQRQKQQPHQKHHHQTTAAPTAPAAKSSTYQTTNSTCVEAINTQLPTFLDCTPDLIPNDTPDEDPLTNFDDLYTFMSSPHVSSYLQYLKEPALHATDTTEFLDFLEGSQPVQGHAMDLTSSSFAGQASLNGLGDDNNNNPLLMYTADSNLYSNPLQLSCSGGGGDSSSNNWPFESGGNNSCILPQNLDNTFGGIGQPVHESVTSGMVSMAECDIAREYVSLSDVNSFVAEVDSQKHAASIHLSYSTPENLQLLGDNDSNHSSSRNASDFATLATFSSVPNMLGSCSAYQQQQHQHTGYATPIQEDDSSDSETESSTQSYGKPIKKWPESDKTSYAAKRATRAARKQAPKKSKSDILLHIKKNRLKKTNAKGLQLKASPSTRHLGASPTKAPPTSSSLPPSESITSILARQKISSSSAAGDDDLEDMDDEEDEEYIFRGDAGAEDDDDDTFTFHPGQSSSGRAASSGGNHHHLRKGRNVDKACNHCKRSHLRCDNMRPCRRCVATGKTGCKDVEHKPRGRPRLNKNQINVKKEILNSILPE